MLGRRGGYPLMAALIAAVLAFTATNIDDILILTLMLAGAYGRKGKLAVMLGQYIGITVLFAISVLGALGARMLPTAYIGLLGLLPIALGVRVLFSREEDDAKEKGGIGILGMCLLTVANGADNIGVYIPLFSGFALSEMLLTALVFAVMTGLWCALGLLVGAFPPVRDRIVKYKRILVPIVLIALGVWILIENYVF